MTTITTGILLRRALGFKDDAIIIKTDADWILAIQKGFNDLEIVGKGALPATCFELGFSNKMKLREFLSGKTDEATLRIGEAWLKFHYLQEHLFLDYGRTINDFDTEIDSREFEDDLAPKFINKLKAFIAY